MSPDGVLPEGAVRRGAVDSKWDARGGARRQQALEGRSDHLPREPLGSELRVRPQVGDDSLPLTFRLVDQDRLEGRGASQDARAARVRVMADAQPSPVAHDNAGLEPTSEGAGASPRLPDLAGGQAASLRRGPDAGAAPNKENATTPAKKPQNQLAPRRPLGFVAAPQQ